MSTPPSTVLVTGAAGFLGRRLIDALLAGDSARPPVRRVIAADVQAGPPTDTRVEWRSGDLADPAFAESVVEPDVDVVFHLAAVLSGGSEENFDLGMHVNVDGTRHLLGACRKRPRRQRFVFSSTLAVYGGALPEIVPEHFALMPSSSYGAEKAIAELLVLEHGRRGFVDGVVCRVPTVAVRPGAPNAALSSFVSGIVREPLAGVETTCPVPLETPLWISGPGAVVRNLLHAATLPIDAFEGRAAVNLPGLTVTPAEMLECLERVAGAEVRARVRLAVDPRVSRIVCSWPGAFDVERPLRLGFVRDVDIDAIVRSYVTESSVAASRRPGVAQ
jgi:nucleoside-diphosphate-sugar epimerase